MHATKVSLADELARLSLQKPLPLIPGDDKQARRRLVRQRINLLERARARSQPNDKWPTTKAVHAYQEKLAQSKPVVRSDCRLAAGVSPSKKQTHDASSLIQSKSVVRPDCRLLSKEVTNDDSAHFPFPVLGVKERAARFMPFQRLPPEIRFEIWKIAAQHPRFIEIQHFAIAKQSNIVKGIGDLVLQVVCRESREIIRQNPTDWSKVGIALVQENVPDSSPEAVRLVRGLVGKRSDTMFLREAEIRNFTWFLPGSYINFHNVEHLALPLSVFNPQCSEGAYPGKLTNILSTLGLETLTLVLGTYQNTWLVDQYVELRDIEEFFLDGRDRGFEFEDWKGDILDLAKHLEGLKSRVRLTNVLYKKRPRFAKHVRVVAWKRKD